MQVVHPCLCRTVWACVGVTRFGGTGTKPHLSFGHVRQRKHASSVDGLLCWN